MVETMSFNSAKIPLNKLGAAFIDIILKFFNINRCVVNINSLFHNLWKTNHANGYTKVDIFFI